MKVFVLIGFAALTLPFYSHAGDPPATPSAEAKTTPAASTTTTAPAAATTAVTNTPEIARTITIDPNAPQPVCKRVVPTGSRIAERRCEAPQTEAQAEANRAALRSDFQAMRDQQMLRDQARQAAAARRRTQ